MFLIHNEILCRRNDIKIVHFWENGYRHKKNKNLKPSSKVEVNNWGKDRNVSESGSCWTRRPTSIRQRPGSGPADRLTQRQLHRGHQDCRGPAREPREGLPPAARLEASCPRLPLSGSIQYFCLALKHQGFTVFVFFLDHLMFLFSRNITLVVKEPTFSLEYKENFGDLSANREVSIKFFLDLSFIRLLLTRKISIHS